MGGVASTQKCNDGEILLLVGGSKVFSYYVVVKTQVYSVDSTKG